MALPTLLNTRSPLASATAQRAIGGPPFPTSFDAAVASGGGALVAGEPTVPQINDGKRCNQACHHCHVDAGPDRTEVMGDAVVEAVLTLVEESEIPTIDVTGGAPEMQRPKVPECATWICALTRQRCLDRKLPRAFDRRHSFGRLLISSQRDHRVDARSTASRNDPRG